MRLLDRVRLHCETLGETAAFRSGGEELSWRTAGEQARAVAAFLRTGRGPVVVYGHKEPWMPVCFLACLLAGRPYLPVDRSWPPDRVRQAAEQAGAGLLLAVEELELPGVPRLGRRELEALPVPAEWPEEEVSDRESAYLIFTSGSTGWPKGVPISRGSLDRFLCWSAGLPGIAARARRGVLNQAGYAFDLSVADLYLSMWTGGTHTALTAEEQRDFSTLYPAVWKSKAGLLVGTPSFLRLCLTDASFCRGQIPALGAVFSCGEVLPPRTAGKLLDRFPDLALYNAYGPTEATCAVTAARITPEDCAGEELPIGTWGGGTAELSIEMDGHPCPPGTVGEIVLRGGALSSGYLDGGPGGFRETPSGLAYGTGDLGVFRDGKLWFRGRKDRQIKYKGYRIEPEEIERTLETLPGVERAAVLPRRGPDGGVRGLTAFLEGEDLPEEGALSRRLAERLPPWMIPGRYRILPCMPLTPNGKCDRKRLEEWL